MIAFIPERLKSRSIHAEEAATLDTFQNSSLIVLCSLVAAVAPAANLTQPTPLTDTEWDDVRKRVGLLDKVSFIPSLLPVIMRHRDDLELTEEQEAMLRGWRKDNYQRMVDVMNEIIERRIALAKSALHSDVAKAELSQTQVEILRLQQELLTIRLSCRELVTATFSPAQWNNLAFILEDYPEFAGLM